MTIHTLDSLKSRARSPVDDHLETEQDNDDQGASKVTTSAASKRRKVRKSVLFSKQGPRWLTMGQVTDDKDDCGTCEPQNEQGGMSDESGDDESVYPIDEASAILAELEEQEDDKAVAIIDKLQYDDIDSVPEGYTEAKDTTGAIQFVKDESYIGVSRLAPGQQLQKNEEDINKLPGLPLMASDERINGCILLGSMLQKGRTHSSGIIPSLQYKVSLRIMRIRAEDP